MWPAAHNVTSFPDLWHYNSNIFGPQLTKELSVSPRNIWKIYTQIAVIKTVTKATETTLCNLWGYLLVASRTNKCLYKNTKTWQGKREQKLCYSFSILPRRNFFYVAGFFSLLLSNVNDPTKNLRLEKLGPSVSFLYSLRPSQLKQVSYKVMAVVEKCYYRCKETNMSSRFKQRKKKDECSRRYFIQMEETVSISTTKSSNL